MLRKIIKIDGERCNGCGACAAACHEGAIEMVEGKAKLAKEDHCDGLGDCLPQCPTGAITFEEREAPAYHAQAVKKSKENQPQGFVCPGSQIRAFGREKTEQDRSVPAQSQLRQWPVQIKLMPVKAPYYSSFTSANKSGKTHTQELTNIGSFEKCWRLKDGVWWLYKQADAQELFSEYFICLLGKRLGFNMAEYLPCSDYVRPRTRAIRTRDFTNGASVNFEPLDAIMGENVDDYIHTYDVLKQFGQNVASDYVSIVCMDALCANPDRHSFNLGVLRDVDTGKVLCLAPNFDNNMALISRGYPTRRSCGGDLLISDFNALLASGAYWKGYSDHRTLPVITEELLGETIRATGLKVRTKDIVGYILMRYQHMRCKP